MEAALALAAISGGFLYNRYKKVREGFDDTLMNPAVSTSLGNDFSSYTKNSATRYNPISNLTNPSRNPLYPEGSNIQEKNKLLRNLLRNVVAKPSDPSFNLSGANMGQIAINDGTGGKAIEGSKICEKITSIDCNAFDDPNFAANCGICHEGGKNSKGENIFGGLFILEDDKLNAEEAAKAMRSRRINYRPTVGQCGPNKFSVTKSQCIKIKNQLECEKQQNFGIPGCSQCFQDEKFYSIDETAGKSDPHFILIGKGTVKITKEGSNTTQTIVLAESPKKVEMQDFKEGQTVTFELIGADSEMAGYIEGNTSSGLFSVDMVRLIEKDSITNAKPRVTNIVQINSGSFNVMRPGRGQPSAVFILKNVFTFLDPSDEDAKLCSASPLITKEESATFLNSSTCFKKDQVPGRYSLDCLKETFTNAGCTINGNGYPSTQEKANILMNDGSKNLSIGEIAAKVYKASLESYSGQRGTQKISLQDWDTVSMFCRGIPITNPCSNPDTNNPVSVECLDYIWKNKGATETGPTSFGATYTNTNASSLSGKAQQFCTTAGTMAPIGDDGQENTKAIEIARSKGGISQVKAFYNNIHGTANDNTKTDSERKTAIQECYGIDLRDIPAFDTTVGDNLTTCVPQTIVATLPQTSTTKTITIKDNWSWSFTIIPRGTVNGWANLFLGNQVGSSNQPGTRLPALYFQPNTTNLFVSIQGKDNKICEIPNIEIPLNKKTNVIINYIDGELVVKTNTDGNESKFSKSCPGCPKGVATLYTPSPWNPRFNGDLTNLSFCTFNSNTSSVLDYKPGRTKKAQSNFQPLETLATLRPTNILTYYGDPNSPWRTTWGIQFPTNKGIQWIWNTPTAASGAGGNPVQFYKFWTNDKDSNIVANLWVSTDNFGKIYVNDNLIGENTGKYQITLPPGENKIHIEARNAGAWATDPAGLAVYCFTDNSTLFVSNESWLTF
jgi:hypothetical protein